MYPLIGQAFYDDIKAMYDKLQPKNTFEQVSSNFNNIPFEKE